MVVSFIFNWLARNATVRAGLALSCAAVVACSGGNGTTALEAGSTTGNAANVPGAVPVSYQPLLASELTLLGGSGGGAGNLDGQGNQARFNMPRAIARDKEGNLYVADKGNKAIRKITPEGKVTTLVSQANDAVLSESAAAEPQIQEPLALAADSTGNVFVARQSQGRLLKVSPQGQVSVFVMITSADTIVGFISPTALAIDAQDNLYVGDSSRGAIYKVTPAGMVSTLVGVTDPEKGTVNGSLAAVNLGYVAKIALDEANNLFVRSSRGLVKITSSGAMTTLLAPNDGTLNDSGISIDGSVQITASGSVLFDDGYAIHALRPDGTRSTLSGVKEQRGSKDGDGPSARFGTLSDMVLDAQGNLIVTDEENHTLRKVTSAGGTSTWAGLADRAASSNELATVEVLTPAQSMYLGNRAGTATFTIDGAGDFYIYEGITPWPPIGVIRKVTQSGIVSDMTVPASTSVELAISQDGELYALHDPCRSIRLCFTPIQPYKYDSASGRWNSVTKMIDAYADQVTPKDARHGDLGGMAIGKNGDMFVTDIDRYIVRRVAPDGRLTTIAGSGVPGHRDGMGIQAQFSWPTAIAFAPDGMLYVADGNVIRRIAPDGMVTTIAGTRGQLGIRLGTYPDNALGRISKMRLMAPDVLHIQSGQTILKLTLR